jgi:hypothetical protein
MFARTSLSLSARLAFVSLAALLVSGAAAAQSSTKSHAPRHETNASRQARIDRTIDDTYAHRWEVFGGGGLLRFRSGASLQRDSQVSWAVSTNYFLSPKLYVLGSAQGSFGYAKVPNNPYGVYNPQINEYFFQGGAGYRFYRREKVALSVQGAGGVADGIFSGGAKGLYGYQLGVWQDGIRPAFSVALNADYNIFPNLAFRFTPLYQATDFASGPGSASSSFQSHVGFNAGIVYRFGHQ